MINLGGYFLGGSIILYYMRTHAWDSKMCELCELCEQLTKMPTWDNCKYATTTIFFVLNCIFFGFRAFYLFFIQNFAVILHRNSKSPHAHRTFIALPSHTRTWVAAMRSSSSAKEQARSLRQFQKVPRPPRSPLWGGRWLQERKIILFNFVKFW